LLGTIGLINRNLGNIRNLLTDIATGNDRQETIDDINNTRTEIDRLIGLLPHVDYLESLELTCDNKSFFETLAMTVKNTTLSTQNFFYKIKSKTKDTLKKQLKTLKQNYVHNQEDIFRLEARLSRIVDSELREEISLNRNFEKLNDEKITPYFMSLAKQSCTDALLSDIRNDNGTDFIDSNDRENYITEYYRNLYTVRGNNNMDNDSIEQFLGDVAVHPDVLGSKLTENEKNDLERPLNLAELDSSVKKGKINTAPGIDGMTNKFILHFWEYFRVPLYKYTLACYDSGSLTDNFRSAKIRLIPKKGDLTNLKNWRPISLLNCFYKIISRAIARRLQKYMDKLTKIGQKGYSSSKQCQEVLINIIDSIGTLKANGKKGALISLDIKKAFDSTSHRYLQLVYNFFNFGPNFIRWLNLLGTNRRAYIILDNELNSAYFDLQRGNAQGDTVSPYIFNLGFQILLFKINYDLQIDGVIETPTVPPDIPPLPREVGTRSYKIFAYADDANMLVKMDVDTLTRLRKILDDFGILSGLECNVDKTTLLQVGVDTPISQEITELGFSVVNTVTILGLKISGSGADTLVSLEDIRNKLQKQVNHWSRFNLSLPGRITVAKTMLYSQINYLGCFLPITDNMLNSYITIIQNFVSGKLNIAKNRFSKEIELGGLGLFDVKNFLDAQKIAWVKRARSLDDWWKISLYSKSYGTVFNIRSTDIDGRSLPCLHNIVTAYENFMCCLTKKNENFCDAFIFRNSALTLGLRDNRVLNELNFTGVFFTAHGHKIKNLCISDLFVDTNFVGYNLFCNNTGLPMSFLQYQMLKGIVETALVRYRKNEPTDQSTTDIATFVNRSKKGSKRFRKILTPTCHDYILHNIVKFRDNVDVVVGIDVAKKLNSFWTFNIYSNSTRTFLFKLYNNTLGYNNAVAHFVRNHSPNCTFCDIVGTQEEFFETPIHLFFNCDVSENFIDSMFKWFVDDNTFDFSRTEFFTIFDRDTLSPAKNYMLTVFSKLVLKFMWDSKQRYSLPCTVHCRVTISTEITSMTETNIKFKKTFQESGFGANLAI
jgi:hypothetical protein